MDSSSEIKKGNTTSKKQQHQQEEDKTRNIRANEKYLKALTECKCGCLDKIDNKIWAINQISLNYARQEYSTKEKDQVIRQALFSQLRRTEFTKRSSQVKLKFDVSFRTPTGDSKMCSLCESCYVIFNDHIGKVERIITNND